MRRHVGRVPRSSLKGKKTQRAKVDLRRGDICAHEIDFHKSLTVFTASRADVVKGRDRAEGMASPSSANPFRCLCLHCLTIDMPLVSVVSVERVVQRDGLFPAITDSPGQGSDWLTINNAGLAQYEKLRVATLHGRLPTSPGSLAHNRLSHSSGTVRNLSLTLPNTSENFKCCTSCSQTLAPFSHTSQTNWP